MKTEYTLVLTTQHEWKWNATLIFVRVSHLEHENTIKNILLAFTDFVWILGDFFREKEKNAFLANTIRHGCIIVLNRCKIRISYKHT